MTRAQDSDRALLRHIVATLAYRASKAIRGAPASFGTFQLTPKTRTPERILSHMSDLLVWALSLAKGPGKWSPARAGEWDHEVQRFYDALAALDGYLASDEPLGAAAAVIFQGPLADAHTHVGQLTLLRGAFGAPVRPESYDRAQIVAGRVGADQVPGKAEFDGDASAR